MDDNERKFMEALAKGVSDLMDSMAQQVGRQIADTVIEEVENVTHDVDLSSIRKPLIYTAIIDRLQAHINNEMRNIKVE